MNLKYTKLVIDRSRFAAGQYDINLANEAEREIVAMQARIEKVCEWGLLDDEEWETSCNETIYMEGLPDEDWKFCPFCGGKIKANK